MFRGENPLEEKNIINIFNEQEKIPEILQQEGLSCSSTEQSPDLKKYKRRSLFRRVRS